MKIPNYSDGRAVARVHYFKPGEDGNDKPLTVIYLDDGSHVYLSIEALETMLRILKKMRDDAKKL